MVVIVVSYRDAFVDDFEGKKFTRISVNLVVTLFDDKVLIKIQGKSCQSKHAWNYCRSHLIYYRQDVNLMNLNMLPSWF